MDKKSLKEKLENLRLQQRQAEATWTKIQGAMEFCEAMLEEDENKNNTNSNGVAKKAKEKATI